MVTRRLTSKAGGDTSLEVNFAPSHVKAMLLNILAGDGDVGGEVEQFVQAECMVDHHVALQDVMHLWVIIWVR